MSIRDGEIIHKGLTDDYTAVLKECGIHFTSEDKEPVVVVKDHLNENYECEGLEVEIRIPGHLGDAADILGMFKSFAQTRALAAQAATKRQVSP